MRRRCRVRSWIQPYLFPASEGVTPLAKEAMGEAIRALAELLLSSLEQDAQVEGGSGESEDHA